MPQRVHLQTEMISREELPDDARILIRFQSEAKGSHDAYMFTVGTASATTFPIPGPARGQACDWLDYWLRPKGESASR